MAACSGGGTKVAIGMDDATCDPNCRPLLGDTVLAWPFTHFVTGFLVVIAFVLTSIIWQSGDRQLSIAPLPRLNGVLRSRLPGPPHGPAGATPAPRNTAHRTKAWVTLSTAPWPPLTVGATSTPDVAQDGGFRAAPSERGIEG
eukprot:EG_transcript_42903